MRIIDKGLSLVGLKRIDTATGKASPSNAPHLPQLTKPDFTINPNKRSKIDFSNSYPGLAAIDEIRNTARGLSVNEVLIKRYAEFLPNLVTGGVGSVIKIPTNDKKDRSEFITAVKKIMAEWDLFCEAPEITGEYTFVELQELLMRGLAIDGEVLIRKHLGHQPKLEIVDVAAIDTSYTLSGNHTEDGDGLIKAYGFGFNRQMERKKIYFREYNLWGNVPFAYNNVATRYEEPAGAFIYEKVNLFVNQVRGISPISSGIFAIELLSKFDNAAMQAMSISALTSLVLEQSEPASQHPRDAKKRAEKEKEKVDMSGINLQPGHIAVVPSGYKTQSFAPPTPSFQFTQFRGELIKKVAAAFGLSYNSTTGDWSNTSYSSSKAAIVQDRELFTKFQYKQTKIIKEIWTWWLAGRVPGGLTPEEIQRIRMPSINNRTWAFLDPGKELTPLINGWLAGIIPAEIIAKVRGSEITEWNDMLKEQELLGIVPYHNVSMKDDVEVDEEAMEEEKEKQAEKDADK